MLFIEYPGSERLAWDGASLYVAGDTGWCSRLLPHRSDIVGGKRRPTFRNHLLEARGDALLVGRTLRNDSQLSTSSWDVSCRPSDRFVRREGGLLSPERTTYLQDSA